MDHSAHNHKGHEHHVKSAPVNKDKDALHHRHNEHQTSPANEGHDKHSGHGSHDKHAGHSPKMFKDRFWISLGLTVPILAFDPHLQSSLGITSLAFPGSEWITPILSVVLFIYGGSPFLVGAIHELKDRKPGMMTLISLAISVAFLFSLFATLGFVGGMPLYWELATLLDIMLLGHWIEMSSIQGASKALEHLASLVPNIAHRLEHDGLSDVPVTELKEGDRVLVKPGEQVPVDGTVVDGRSSFNESFLTGESKPVTKTVGDEVLSGSVNGEGAITFQITRTGDKTTLNQIQRLVADAQASRSGFQNLADRAAGWLTYIAISAGLITFASWLLFGSEVEVAVIRTVAVLVMACPHALGLAIPLVIVNATSLLAKHGILVRNREAFERARDLKQVAFDKTGTLTEGHFGLLDMKFNRIDESQALSLAGSLESHSEHPLAVAIASAAKERNIRFTPMTDFTVDAGRGVSAFIVDKRYYVGSITWAKERSVNISELLLASADNVEGQGSTVISLFSDEEMLAVFALGDNVREDAKQAIELLARNGVRTVMITGDSEVVAKSVARTLGIDEVHARVLPQDKARIISELRKHGSIAFVGDGVNDAPALLEADLGIAIGAGTNVAIESADLVLINSKPSDVANALVLSRLTYRKMVQNLVWATGYNAIALPLAAGVAIPLGIVISPAIGAIFMSASTVIVALNALLLRRTRLP